MKRYKERMSKFILYWVLGIIVLTGATWVTATTPRDGIAIVVIGGWIGAIYAIARSIAHIRDNAIIVYPGKIYIRKIDTKDIKKQIDDTLAFEDIFSVKLVNRLIRKVEIKGRYKSVPLHLGSYKEYKEILAAVIEGTKNNKNIYVDENIYKLIEK